MLLSTYNEYNPMHFKNMPYLMRSTHIFPPLKPNVNVLDPDEIKPDPEYPSHVNLHLIIGQSKS